MSERKEENEGEEKAKEEEVDDSVLPGLNPSVPV